MNRIAKTALWLALLIAPLQAQCCVGAQDQNVLSSNGRYRVVAKSLTGTGPGSHGPYHFRFTTYRVGEGDQKAIELGAFERHWDSRAHFHMEVIVSPTGNGFVLGCPMQQEVQFFAPDGRMLREINCGFGQHVDSYGHLRKKTPWQKHSVRLFAKGHSSRQTELWIPLAQIVGPELQAQPRQRGKPTTYAPIAKNAKPLWPPLAAAEKRWLMSMLTWSPARGAHEEVAAHRAMHVLLAEPLRRSLQAPLIELGLSALPLVRAQQAQVATGDCRAALTAVIAQIEQRLCGHKEPWRNRELLAAVAEHPDVDLRNCARGRLRALAVKK